MFSLIESVIHFLLPCLLAVSLGLGVVVKIGTPYYRYVVSVSQADTDKGKEEFARYLAASSGGKKIQTEDKWQSFLPAADELYKAHLERRAQFFE